MITINHILVPTDFSEIAEDAINCAYDMALVHNAKLDIVHVFEEPAFPSFYGAGALLLYGEIPDIRKQAKVALEKLAEPLREKNKLDLHTRLLDGHAADQICAFAKEEGVDLIVIPTYGLTGLRHILLGSVAERVVREAHCPVFVYKSLKEKNTKDQPASKVATLTIPTGKHQHEITTT